MNRIYLDNAATSWPKPDSVLQVIDDFYRHLGISAGRGNSSLASQLDRQIEVVRSQVARLIHARDSNEIVFTFSGTDSLSTSLLGVLNPGDHVVTTAIEHNSVLRPLRYLEKNRSIEVTTVDCDENGTVDPRQIESAFRSSTRLVAISHASNVVGKTQDVDSVARSCRKRNVLSLVDAAQTLGYLDIDVQKSDFDMLCAPGHKGLLGPLGTGVLYLRSEIQSQVRPLRFGGTGTSSDSVEQPECCPQKFESGNLNAAGILAIGAGITEIIAADHSDKITKMAANAQRLIDGIESIESIRVLGRFDPQTDIPIVSFVHGDIDCREFATMLDASFGIQCRAGFHCAPRIHPILGSGQNGSVRLSLSLETTTEQVKQTIAAIHRISASF